MKQWINRIIWGLFFYLIFLIATLPAYLLVSRIELGNQVKLGNVSGTIWSGQIDQVKIDKTILKNVRWDYNFSQLLTAQLAVDLTFGHARKILEPQGSAQLRYGLNGPSLADAKVKLPADLIVQQLEMPFKVQASGLVEANIAQAQLGEPVCHSLVGDIDWKLAGVNAMKTSFDYGDISAKLSCDNGAVVAQVKGNPELLVLDINARLNTYQSYSVEGYISAGSKASKDLQAALSYLGNPDSQGRYLIKFNQ